MSYKIKSSEVKEDTLNVTVEYTFKDGSTEEIVVANFMPETKEQVLTSLGNREVSEQRKRDATVKNTQLKVELDKQIG